MHFKARRLWIHTARADYGRAASLVSRVGLCLCRRKSETFVSAQRPGVHYGGLVKD
jgi:hypothetical protein